MPTDKQQPEGMMQQVSEVVSICKSYFPNLFEHPSYNGKFYRLISALREQWEEERQLQPVPGPPSLDGVPDDALFVRQCEAMQPNNTWAKGTVHIKSAEDMRAGGAVPYIRTLWHIPLGVITPPLAADPLPKCPVCGELMMIADRKFEGKVRFRLSCLKDPNSPGGNHDVCFYGPTKEAAIAAARKAGR